MSAPGAGLLLGFPNRADQGTLSGGSWEADLPLSNLQTRFLAQVARSTDAAQASTQFDLDLGVELYVRVLALPRHNLTRDALVRFRASNAADFSALEYDSGWLDVYPVIYPTGTLDFGDPGFFDGKLAQVDYDLGYRVDIVHIVDPAKSGRYWRVEIDDEANPNGYVDLGRLWVSYAYEPSGAPAVGSSLGWETSSTSWESRGGALIHDVRPRRRFVDVTGTIQDMDETLVRGFELMRQLGTAGQLFVVWDKHDTTHLHRRSFLASIRELTPLEMPWSKYARMGYRLREEL